MILWHLVAIGITFALVESGFDWRYFELTRNPVLISWMFPTAPIGGLVPLALPLILVLVGIVLKHPAALNAGWAVAQAELIGSVISSCYKAFTGRVHPSFILGGDISRDFRFGLLRGGVFWGWPSSHTTIAFAMAVTIFILLPKQRWAGSLAICYALYIGTGVSMTIHWFSDSVAGMIVGSVTGAVVGKSFYSQPNVAAS